MPNEDKRREALVEEAQLIWEALKYNHAKRNDLAAEAMDLRRRLKVLEVHHGILPDFT